MKVAFGATPQRVMQYSICVNVSAKHCILGANSRQAWTTGADPSENAEASMLACKLVPEMRGKPVCRASPTVQSFGYKVQFPTILERGHWPIRIDCLY
jgi:hypothetical protein